MDTKNVHNITSTELWFLFSLHAPAIIIGFPDPTLGFLADEIEGINRRAQDSLLKKRVITRDANGQWIVHEPIAGWIRSITAPKHSIIIMRHDKGSVDMTRSFHFTGDQIIALYSEGSDECTIGPVENTRAIHEFMLEPFLTTVYSDNSDSPIEISEKDLAKAQSQIEEEQINQAKETLNSSFIVDEQLNRFVLAMSNPSTRLSLVAFLHRDQAGSLKETKGFSIIAGEQDIWSFRPMNSDLNCVQVSSITKVTLENTITTFLPQLEGSS